MRALDGDVDIESKYDDDSADANRLMDMNEMHACHCMALHAHVDDLGMIRLTADSYLTYNTSFFSSSSSHIMFV